PLRRSYDLAEPFVVLDNNVFAHYEQLLALPLAAGEELAFTLVVPSLVLGNQSPVLSGSAVYVGQAAYQLQEGQLLLDEYIITMPGNLQIRLLAEADRLIRLEIPLQAVEVVREGYLGLKEAASEKQIGRASCRERVWSSVGRGTA